MKETESTANRLLLIIRLYHHKLTAMDGVAAGKRPSKNKWSRKEVLGHLVDSAANNHRRFVISHKMKDMVFEGYNQNQWVASQDYNERNWQELVTLWKSFNIHIAHIIRHYNQGAFIREHTLHNLHKISFNTLLEDEPATIHYLAEDYVDHMEYHLKRMI